MFEMSKMRMPRKRVSGVATPSVAFDAVQSRLALRDSTDTNSRLPWTDTSF